jgi:hypothetical protein
VLRSNGEFGWIPGDPAMCPTCRVRLRGEEHHRREGHIEHRQPLPDRIPYTAALLVAAVLGFEGTRIALDASDAAKATPRPPVGFQVEMAKPSHCSIKTPDRLFFL